MDEHGQFATLLALLDELAAENLEVPIVVEGQRDVASLRQLGCRGEIHALHAGIPLMALAEKLARDTPRVILLTDWDRKGEILFAQFSVNLHANNVRVHGQYRDRLGACSNALHDVESLAGYVERRLALHGQDLDRRLAASEGRGADKRGPSSGEIRGDARTEAAPPRSRAPMGL